MRNRSLGILFVLLSALCFALMAAFVRLAGELPFVQKGFFRNFVAFCISLCIFLRKRKEIRIHRENLPLHAARALAGTVGLLGNYYAIDHLVLSDASMLNKMSPFFAVLFSFLLLKEKLTRTQCLAIAAAFLGSMLVVKPTFANLDMPATAFGFAGGMAAGLAYTIVRLLGRRGEKNTAIVFLFSGTSCLLLLPGLLMSFVPMTWRQVVFMLCAGTAAAGGQFAVTAAYNYAPAREISVYDYAQVIFAAILGLFLFGQVADFYSFLGYAVIIGSALFLFYYNNRRDRLTRGAG